MSQLWMDGFDHYGGDIDEIFEGAWAAQFGTTSCVELSSDQARTGSHSLKLTAACGTANQERGIRRVFPSAIAEVFTAQGVYVDGLPRNDTRCAPMSLRDGSNNSIVTIVVGATGQIIVRSGGITGSDLGQTTGPVISSNTWHHIECRFVRSDTVGVVEVRVDTVEVLNLTNQDLGTDDFAQAAIVSRSTDVLFTDGSVYYVDDVITRDATGAFNNDFEGDLRVDQLQGLANHADQGWATRSIEKLGVGVLNLQGLAGLGTDRSEGVIYDDDAALEIGAQDFAVETFVRFNSAITGSQNETILSKYQTTNDQRSWRLWHDGPDNSSNLHFSVSSLGTFASVTDIHTFPFVPVLNRWYHIAVSREGTTSRMFINGIQAGIDETDSVAYFNGVAPVLVAGLYNLGNDDVTDLSSVDGWVDGTRITIGSARYTANFDPPTDVMVDDANTQLLLNYDDAANTDDSSNAFVGALTNGCFVEFPDDSVAYQTIDGLTPNDDDFVEAALIPAVGTLTFTANPLDTETVVLGATTYTFQTVLVDAANNVLIGATTQDSLDNLKAAVNLEAGAGTTYGTATVANVSAAMIDLPSVQLLAQARVPGAAGNTITSTTTVTGGSWSNATLLGGLDIPTNSAFILSALSPDVTGVRSLAIIGRNFKTDAGVSQMQMSFVTVGDDAADGADNVMTLDPTYYEDTIEQDPTTLGALTPSSITGSRISLNRTV